MPPRFLVDVFVLFFCADLEKRDMWLLFMLLFGESARPVRDDDEEEDEDEDEVENE